MESSRLDSKGWEAAGFSTAIPESWWAPLVAEIPRGSSVLELGAGIGNTARQLMLADMDYKFHLMDFSKSLLKTAYDILEKYGNQFNPITYYKVDVLNDASKEFWPHVDVCYSSGLLEHFQHDEIVSILEASKYYAKRVISLVPNAKCKPYMDWKAKKEADGTWEYGFEQPYETMEPFFAEAGLKVLREYSVGLNFQNDGSNEKYLLVTVGESV